VKASKETEIAVDSVIKGFPDIIYRLDSQGNITFVNDAVAKYGYSTQHLIGTNILDLVHPDDRDKATFKINERRTGTRSTKSLEVRMFPKGISRSSLQNASGQAVDEAFFLVDAEGLYGSKRPHEASFVGTQGIARDITELRKSEERLRQQIDFLSLVLESLPHPFYVINVSDYTISLANKAARLSRLTKDATCYALTHRRKIPCDSAEHPCPVEQVKRTRNPVTVEHVHYDKDGNPRDVEVHAYPIFNKEGNVVQIIESTLDITEHKRMEKEREHLIVECQEALAKVKTLSGLLPICASCKRIRDDKGYWKQIEDYISDHSEAEFSHGICPECGKRLYGKYLREGNEDSQTQ
jgi:PAS domain S-box-containing protein